MIQSSQWIFEHKKHTICLQMVKNKQCNCYNFRDLQRFPLTLKWQCGELVFGQLILEWAMLQFHISMKLWYK